MSQARYAAPVSPQCCGIPICAIWQRYWDTPVRHILFPTLDGLRVAKVHVAVPVLELEAASPGEKHAISWYDKTFLSTLVPPAYVRYILVHFYHALRYAHPLPGIVKVLSSEPRRYRSILIELGLARWELTPKGFREYWTWRQTACRLNFFGRCKRTMKATEGRIDRLAELWGRLAIAPGISSVAEIATRPGDPLHLAYSLRKQAMSLLELTPRVVALLS